MTKYDYDDIKDSFDELKNLYDKELNDEDINETIRKILLREYLNILRGLEMTSDRRSRYYLLIEKLSIVKWLEREDTKSERK